MAKVIYYSALIAVFVLVVATLLLVWVNRSPKIYAPLMSVVLAAVAAALITLVTILKPAQIVEAFPVSIALDRKTHLVLQVPDDKIDGAHLQHDLAAKANFEESEPGVQRYREIHFATDDEKLDFYAQLLQLELIRQCYGILRYDVEVSSSTSLTGPSLARSRVFDDFNPHEFSKLPGTEIGRKMSANKFFDRLEKNFWNDSRWLPVPAKAILTIPDGRMTIIERAGYFRATIQVEPLAGGQGLPPHLVDVVQMKNGETASFIIRMRADFDRFTSESPYTASCKKWVEYLFPRLKANMADPLTP